MKNTLVFLAEGEARKLMKFRVNMGRSSEGNWRNDIGKRNHRLVNCQ